MRIKSTINLLIYLSLFLVVTVGVVLGQEDQLTERLDISDQGSPKASEIFRDYKIIELELEDEYRSLQKHSSALLQFPFSGEEYEFELQQNQLLGGDYQLRTSSKGESQSSNRAIPVEGWTSTSLKGSFAIANDFVYGTWQDPNGEEAYIEPYRFYDKNAKSNQFVVFFGEDIIDTVSGKCGVEHEHRFENKILRSGIKSNSNSNCMAVELAIASDYLMFEKYGSVQDVENRNIGVINDVQNNYLGEFDFDFYFEIVEQFVVDCSGCDPWTSSTDASELLDSFTTWGPSGFNNEHDVGELWTDRDLDGSTVGNAWLGALCGPNRYHMCQDFSSNNEFIRVLTAHEMGHNFNMTHDASGAPYIMAPAVNSSNDWSNQSVSQINNYVPGLTCISELLADVEDIQNEICPGSCDGMATATGGTNYEWSDGQTTATATDLCPGTYEVTVSDLNGCSDVASVTIEPGNGVNATATVDQNETCIGDCNGVATASGGSSYSWSNGQTTATATGLCAGTYDVTVSSNGCDDVASITMNVDPDREAPVPDISSSGEWDEAAKVLASDGVEDDRFGAHVSISGAYAIVGSIFDDDNGNNSGSAYIFHWTGSSWMEQAKLTASDGGGGDNFGSVSISGDYAIIGSSGDDDNGFNSGSAYIFHRTGSSWTEQAKLTASDGASQDYFGGSVSIDGSYAIVGAARNDENGNNSGAGYIYHRSGSNWTEQAKLTASDGASQDYFGGSVSIDENYVIVGADGDDDNGISSGSSYIFHRTGSNWTEQVKLTASDGASEDYFGTSVSISGEYAIIGALRDDDNGDDSGSSYIFHRSGSSWVEEAKLTASDANPSSFFGRSVSISGDDAIVGAYQDDENGDDSGSSYIFHRSGGDWMEETKLIASDGAADDQFGNSVSISGDYAIVGALWDDDNGDDSGSAYFFKPTWENLPTIFAECSAMPSAPTATDNCAGTVIGTTPTSFPIFAQDTTTIIWTYEDNFGNITTQNQDVILEDLTNPVAICPTTPPTVVLDGSGSGTLPENALADGNSTDNCDTGLVETSPEVIFTCSDAPSATVVLTATDVAGNTSTATCTVNIDSANCCDIEIDEISASHESCLGICDGTAMVTHSGGVGPFEYLWNDPDGQATATATGLCGGSYIVTVTDDTGCSVTASVTVDPGADITASVSVDQDESCEGACDGEATASGGTNYEWSDGQMTSTATDLCPGSYEVTVSDVNGCSDVTSVNIEAGNNVTASASVDQDESCEGACDGEATASGGMNYEWSDGQTTATATDLCPGSYEVTVTGANGCTDAASVNIQGGSGVTATALVENHETCEGDCDGQATAIGGVDYVWSDGQMTATATDLCPGSYEVTVTGSNGCTDVASVAIQSGSSVTATAIVDTHENCLGDCDGEATASGGTNYEWSDGQTTATATNLCPGSYQVTVSDANGCSDVTSVIIESGGNVMASASVNQDESCEGACDGQATATGGTSYEWSDGQTTATATDLCAGSYEVTVSDANGCSDVTSVNIESGGNVTASASVDQDESCEGACDGEATASGGTNYEWSDGQMTATATDLCPGSYEVTVTGANGCTDVASVAIQAGNSVTATAIVNNHETCLGDCDGQATATGGVDYAWSNGQMTATATDLCAGSYEVTVTGANGCTDVASVAIQAGNSVTATAIVDNHETCLGDCDGQATATGGTSYEWSDGQTTATATDLCPGSFEVTVSDGNGCSDVTSVNIEAGSNVTASVSVDQDESCEGACDGEATASGGTNYEWSDGQTTATGTDLCPGSYEVTVSDVNGCSDVTSVIIQTGSNVTASVSVDQDESCEGACDGEATASGGTNYEWSDGQTTATATDLCVGSYEVTVSDANGCSDVVTVMIEEGTSPDTPIFSLDTSMCLEDDPVNLPATSENDVPGTWSGTGVSSNTFDPQESGAGNFDLTFTPNTGECAESIVITMEVEDCGCQDPASADAGEDVAVCGTGDPVQLDGSIGNVSEASWTSSGSGSFDDPEALDAVYTPSGADMDSGSIVLTLTTADPDGSGPCSPASDELVISFTFQPDIDPVDDLEGCDYVVLPMIEGEISPAIAYYTETGGAGEQYAPGDTLFTSMDLFVYDTVGSCVDETTLEVTINRLEVDAGDSVEILYGATAALSAGVSGGTGNYIIQWSPSDLVVTTDSLETETDHLTESQWFILTVTDTETGCESMDSVLVVVTGDPLRINTSATTREICLGDSSTITAYATGGTGEYTFEWRSDPEGFTSGDQSIRVSPEDTTVYNLRVDDGYWSIVTSVQIVVHYPPLADAGLDGLICPDAERAEVCADSIFQATYFWESTEGVLDSGRCASLTVGKWILNVIDTNTCSARDTIEMEKSDLMVTLYPDSSAEISGGVPPYDTLLRTENDTLEIGVIDAEGCLVTDRVIMTSVTDPTLFENVKIYPNPVGEGARVKIDGLESPYTMRLYNNHGVLVRKEESPRQVLIEQMPVGSYYLELTKESKGKGSVIRYQLVVK